MASTTARRRSKRLKVRSDIGWVLAVLGLFAAIAIGRWINQHRALSIIVAVLLLAVAGGAFAFRLRVRRERRRIQAERAKHISSYHQMDDKEFEHGLAALCKRDGCRDVQVVGGANDLAADVLLRIPDGRRMLIQAKRYTPGNKVGSPDVQCVGGTYSVVHGADLAAVVTTSTFTPAAVSYAKRAGIRLYDHGDLAAWAAGGRPPWN